MLNILLRLYQTILIIPVIIIAFLLGIIQFLIYCIYCILYYIFTGNVTFNDNTWYSFIGWIEPTIIKILFIK